MKIIPVFYPWRGIWVGVQAICGTSGKCVLVDTGLDDTVKTAITPALLRHGLKLSDIALVINTHFHGDHSLCNLELRQCTGAGFAIHRLGADLLYREQQFASDILLDDGESIQEGDIQLEIIHTPGHSPDSICILEKSTGTLFAGDSIQGCGIEALGTPLWENTEAYRNSLKKLFNMYESGRIRSIYLGHQFLPSPPDGILHGSEAGIFLRETLNTVEKYTAFAAERQGYAPDAFHAEMLSAFRLKPNITWKDASRNMADFLLHTCGKQTVAAN